MELNAHMLEPADDLLVNTRIRPFAYNDVLNLIFRFYRVKVSFESGDELQPAT